jgi:hypothetical protein
MRVGRTTARSLPGTVAIGVLAALVASSPVGAQDGGTSGVPVEYPGEYDRAAAEAEFGRLSAVVGAPAATSDDSSLIGPCGGFVYSYDEDGELVDAVMDRGDDAPPVDVLDGGQALTEDNPFEVDTRGRIVYFGFAPRSGEGPIGQRWSIDVAGIGIENGSDPNENGSNRATGVTDLGEELPVTFTARTRAEVRMDADNLEPCVGGGYVVVRGDGLTDPVGLAALSLLVVGLAGIVFNARPARSWRA